MSQINRTKPALLTAGKPKKVKIHIYPHVLKKGKESLENQIKSRTLVHKQQKLKKLESKTVYIYIYI